MAKAARGDKVKDAGGRAGSNSQSVPRSSSISSVESASSASSVESITSITSASSPDVVADRAGRQVRQPLLDPLVDAARVAQFKEQYANPNGRVDALRAMLRDTCESYLIRAGASLFESDPGHVRMLRLLMETHAQGLLRAARGRRQHPEDIEMLSMLQLAELMAKEYVAAVRGVRVLYRHPVPVDTLRPVKKYRCSTSAKKTVALCGNLRRGEKSAFYSVPPNTPRGTSSDNDCSVISSSEKEDGLSESEYDEVESSEDEYEECRLRGDLSEAQCPCYKCVLGEDNFSE